MFNMIHMYCTYKYTYTYIRAAHMYLLPKKDGAQRLCFVGGSSVDVGEGSFTITPFQTLRVRPHTTSTAFPTASSPLSVRSLTLTYSLRPS